eukprot:4618776-Pyramimonas_sp.AAC.1
MPPSIGGGPHGELVPVTTKIQGLQANQLIVLVHVPQNSGRAGASPNPSFRPEGLAPHAIQSPAMLPRGPVILAATSFPGLS